MLILIIRKYSTIWIFFFYTLIYLDNDPLAEVVLKLTDAVTDDFIGLFGILANNLHEPPMLFLEMSLIFHLWNAE